MPPTAGSDAIIVHGTAIAAGGRAILLRGPSGTGKSDLALRAMAAPLSCLLEAPFALVADDQVVVSRSAEGLNVAAHPRLEGLIEVRGLGILRVPHVPGARLSLIADLTDPRDIVRMPDPWPFENLLGVRLPVVRIAPFEASAPVKLALALSRTPWVPQSP